MATPSGEKLVEGTESALSAKAAAGNDNMLIVKSPTGDSSKDSFSSTLKSSGSGSTDNSRRSGEPHDEYTMFLFLGCVQMVLGVLMSVFGVLAIVHEASLSNVGAGLWGGAVAMASGVVGILAGLRGCYSVGGERVSPVFVTAFLALCLVSLAVSNLVVVLTVTGLVRDGQQPDIRLLDQLDDSGLLVEGEDHANWQHLLSNCGLLLVSSLQCVTAVISGYRCYRRVCPCLNRDNTRALNSSWHPTESPEPSGSFYSTSSKEMLISNWLGQHPTMSLPRQPQHGNIVLIPQTAITRHQGQFFTFPTPPSLITYPHIPGPRFINPMVQSRYMVRGTPSHLRSHAIRSKRKRESEERRRRRHHEGKRRHGGRKQIEPPRPVTEEEVARTYTGLDREIAEEFIAIAMEPGVARTRQNRPMDNSTVSHISDQ